MAPRYDRVNLCFPMFVSVFSCFLIHSNVLYLSSSNCSDLQSVAVSYSVIPITTHDVVAEKLIPFICKKLVQITVFSSDDPNVSKSAMLKSANVIRFGFKVVLTVFSSDY